MSWHTILGMLLLSAVAVLPVLCRKQEPGPGSEGQPETERNCVQGEAEQDCAGEQGEGQGQGAVSRVSAIVRSFIRTH
jgi:hypothetical protein